MARSTYTTKIIDGVICVVDLNGPRSVTNDAERVIEALYEASGHDMPEPVIYRDPTGTWDGLEHKDGAFVGFYLIHARDREIAIAKAKARVK